MIRRISRSWSSFGDASPRLQSGGLAGGNSGFLIRHQQKCSEDKRHPWDAADSVWKPSSAPTCFLHFLAFPSRFRQTRNQMMMVFQGNCKLKELLLRLCAIRNLPNQSHPSESGEKPRHVSPPRSELPHVSDTEHPAHQWKWLLVVWKLNEKHQTANRLKWKGNNHYLVL